MRILTNDPSVTGWGWAVLEMKNGRSRILDSGCIKTQPEHKKRRIRKSDDTIRRLDEIIEVLIVLHTEYTLDWIVSELPSGSQSASAASMLGAVTGVMETFAKVNNLPIDWFSEQDAKKFLLKKKSATKQETIDAVSKLYGKSWQTDVKYKDEAVADALQVFHVAKAKSQALIFMTNK